MAVLYLAQKYDVNGLPEQCSEFIVKNMNVDSVLEIYRMAEMLGQESLRKRAFTFMLA
jgi:hypothetical protein